jgi:hypothetical protein
MKWELLKTEGRRGILVGIPAGDPFTKANRGSRNLLDPSGLDNKPRAERRPSKLASNCLVQLKVVGEVQ